jgi:hypothetical protein
MAYHNSEGNGYSAYQSNYGWNNSSYKTITITSEPPDETFKSWLNANATKQ